MSNPNPRGLSPSRTLDAARASSTLSLASTASDISTASSGKQRRGLGALVKKKRVDYPSTSSLGSDKSSTEKVPNSYKSSIDHMSTSTSSSKQSGGKKSKKIDDDRKEKKKKGGLLKGIKKKIVNVVQVQNESPSKHQSSKSSAKTPSKVTLSPAIVDFQRGSAKISPKTMPPVANIASKISSGQISSASEISSNPEPLKPNAYQPRTISQGRPGLTASRSIDSPSKVAHQGNSGHNLSRSTSFPARETFQSKPDIIKSKSINSQSKKRITEEKPGIVAEIRIVKSGKMEQEDTPRPVDLEEGPKLREIHTPPLTPSSSVKDDGGINLLQPKDEDHKEKLEDQEDDPQQNKKEITQDIPSLVKVIQPNRKELSTITKPSGISPEQAKTSSDPLLPVLESSECVETQAQLPSIVEALPESTQHSPQLETFVQEEPQLQPKSSPLEVNTSPKFDSVPLQSIDSFPEQYSEVVPTSAGQSSTLEPTFLEPIQQQVELPDLELHQQSEMESKIGKDEQVINYASAAQRLRSKKPNLQRETLERMFQQRTKSESETENVTGKITSDEGSLTRSNVTNGTEEQGKIVSERPLIPEEASLDDEIEIVEEYLEKGDNPLVSSNAGSDASTIKKDEEPIFPADLLKDLNISVPEPSTSFPDEGLLSALNARRLSLISECGSDAGGSFNASIEALSVRRGSDFTDSFKKLEPFKFDLPAVDEGKRERLYKVLVVGELGTGKTSIIKRYVHQFFSQHYRATIGVDFALKVLRWDQETVVRLQLWDIAGQERFGSMTRVYYKEAVGAFVVFDVTRSATLEAVPKWKADLDSKVVLPDGRPIPAVLLANKCDQPKEGLAANREKMNEFCQQQGFSAWFETSARDNIMIEDAANFLVSKILEMDKWSQEPMASDPDKVALDGRRTGTNASNSCPC